MREAMPYIVSILVALISFFGSLLVNRKNNKVEIEKMKLEHKQIMERNKQEQDARIEYLEKEMAMKMGTQLISDLTNKTMEAVYSSNAVKSEINKQAFKTINSNNKKRR